MTVNITLRHSSHSGRIGAWIILGDKEGGCQDLSVGSLFVGKNRTTRFKGSTGREINSNGEKGSGGKKRGY